MDEQDHPPAGYHHGNLRQALLAAARELLEERGPGALGLREIARRVGVSAPSAYHHFASLDAIAASLAEQGFTEFAEQLEAAPTNAGGMLAPTGEAYIAFARANPALYRLMFGEGLRGASRESKAVRALRQRAYEKVKAGLRKRLPADEVPAAALFLWSLTHGLALLMIDGQVDAGADASALIRQVLKLSGTGLPSAG
ncbi:TetR/AcrR family transcriptional regulator [Phyllobacterium myrsinacearum]|uniref:TetR family transcriptional regulator n=1 Tax=Phyllobacterium myrsinacearum TaxID=28101 RepID=A0A2S9JDV5_9HYPH|nr:TetR/AcrR family transcriptional regulator [Phyllobacterium myrsinacearum]PRD51075.1 TetR family transcriptional regulator [Phyllobacterium myrsinacearum]PWV88214.1 TetR family transcriptional regulator [Phyllobacterium myrsinacearum]RZU97505.1 TetR family transcriptional regulator [Phyllobacterium myrsinacearum]